MGGSDQYKFVMKDLASVDRSKTPWLIVMYHAPIYNSSHAHHNEKEEVELREVFEAAFLEYHVNVVFSGHVHAVEFTGYVSNNQTVADGKAPRYFNIGDGGNREGLAADYYEQPDWSDFREAAYGHGKLYIANATHMRWDWHRDLDKECKVSYSTTIV